MMPEPVGYDEYHPARVRNLTGAVQLAVNRHRKVWVRLDGEPDGVYEVYPGGRNTYYSNALLDRRRKRRELPLPAKDRPREKNWESRYA